MEMTAIDDIAVGEDLTPPLPPLAAVLHDAALSSYCSACFSTLPPQPFRPFTPIFPKNSRHVPSDTPTPLYCSLSCSSIDSPLHFSSAEPHLLSIFTDSPPSTWTASSDLRLSLRLLHIFQNLPPKYNTAENMERIGGLMTNQEKLVLGELKNRQYGCSNENRENCEDSDESTENILVRIKEGAKMMARARGMCVNEDEIVEREEMVLCLVMTNAVEVQDKNGLCIGIAVYDTAFSWINHSCTPNACYRFSMGPDCNDQPFLRIARAAKDGCVNGDGNGLIMEEKNGYGPRVIVRSIKTICKGEEVTIAYTDLLQPKEMRQAELWSKYRFSCSCKRCAAVPKTYVDYALQALSAFDPDSDSEIENLMQNFDVAMSDYLSFDDPKSCCKKIENLLSHGGLNDESLKPKEGKSPQTVKLHHFHHLSLSAYTTLASAYKVQASDLLLALSYDVERHKREAFNMFKTSSAYSLLLAGAANHLFVFESSLMATVANFWTNAGESLLNLAKSPSWNLQGPISSNLSSSFNHKCDRCCLLDSSAGQKFHQKMQLEEMMSQLYNCIADITPKVWGVLSSGSSFLKLIQNPIDLSWLASPETFMIPKGYTQLEGEECFDQLRMNLFLLSIHCLRYGALLSSICYGLSAEKNCNRTLEIIEEFTKF